MVSRGIRNNNPLNIRHGEQWEGMSPEQEDTSFVSFISPEYGVRAATKILQSYRRKGINTVEGVVSRWAPPSENDTEEYINFVCGKTGFTSDEVIDLEGVATIIALLKAMITMENGSQPYHDGVFVNGVGMGLGFIRGGPDA